MNSNTEKHDKANQYQWISQEGKYINKPSQAYNLAQPKIHITQTNREDHTLKMESRQLTHHKL